MSDFTWRLHTPGPWEAEGATVIWEAPGSNNRWIVCDLADGQEGKLSLETEANARLIAAAPDMLAVLMVMREACLGAGSDNAFLWQECDRVIAKAEGREP